MHILLVEDNPSILQLYERIFMTHEVIGLRNAERALEVLAENQYQFDLVILDMHLEKISGLEVLRVIRNQNKEIPVFAISADDTLKLDAQDLGIQRWMTKPIEIEELMSAVMTLSVAQ